MELIYGLLIALIPVQTLFFFLLPTPAPSTSSTLPPLLRFFRLQQLNKNILMIAHIVLFVLSVILFVDSTWKMEKLMKERDFLLKHSGTGTF